MDITMLIFYFQEKLVNSMTREDFEPATGPEDEVGTGHSH